MNHFIHSALELQGAYFFDHPEYLCQRYGRGHCSAKAMRGDPSREDIYPYGVKNVDPHRLPGYDF